MQATQVEPNEEVITEFRILGPVEAWKDGSEVALDGAKQRTVLAALLLTRQQVLSDMQLGTLLWGSRPPATSEAQIYTYVSRLRRYLGDAVEITRRYPGYLMHVAAGSLDCDIFEEKAKRGRTALQEGHFEEAAWWLRSALSLWRGPALANVTEFMMDTERARLEEIRLAALEARIEADLALCRHSQLVPELTGLVSQFPLHERFRAQLMITLYRCGRQADALMVYEDGRRILAEELGVDPGALMRGAHQAVITADPRLDGPFALTSEPRLAYRIREVS